MNCELAFRGNKFGYQGNGDDHRVNEDNEYVFDEPEYGHPGHKYREEVECEGASEHRNHPNGVRELRGSEWTTDEEEATVGYATYPDPTSNISICPPTPNNELDGSDYLTAYPSPTSPFIYDDIDKLCCDYEDDIPGAIESPPPRLPNRSPPQSPAASTPDWTFHLPNPPSRSTLGHQLTPDKGLFKLLYLFYLLKFYWKKIFVENFVKYILFVVEF